MQREATSEPAAVKRERSPSWARPVPHLPHRRRRQPPRPRPRPVERTPSLRRSPRRRGGRRSSPRGRGARRSRRCDARRRLSSRTSSSRDVSPAGFRARRRARAPRQAASPRLRRRRARSQPPERRPSPAAPRGSGAVPRRRRRPRARAPPRSDGRGLATMRPPGHGRLGVQDVGDRRSGAAHGSPTMPARRRRPSQLVDGPRGATFPGERECLVGCPSQRERSTLEPRRPRTRCSGRRDSRLARGLGQCPAS